jgi:GWxTD domain-containing protein
MSVALRDATSGRSTSIDVPLEVLRLGPDGLSSAVVSYEATPRQTLDTMPRIVARPRATAAFGQDSTVDVFVEGYGEGTTSTLPVRVTVRGERGVTVWSDSSSLGRHGALYAGIVRVPVSRLGIGLLSLDVIARRAAGVPNASDSVRAPLFVSLGEDLPVTTFEDVLGYLRYFASPERLRALREMPLDARGTAWLTFLRETDPSPTTPENEGLRDYFARIRNANLRFVDEGGPGWMTDRGMTYIVLGEPDQIVDPAGQDANARGREQVWEYRQPHERITFEDRSGMGRWRLTSQSATVVQSALRRRQTP